MFRKAQNTRLYSSEGLSDQFSGIVPKGWSRRRRKGRVTEVKWPIFWTYGVVGGGEIPPLVISDSLPLKPWPSRKFASFPMKNHEDWVDFHSYVDVLPGGNPLNIQQPEAMAESGWHIIGIQRWMLMGFTLNFPEFALHLLVQHHIFFQGWYQCSQNSRIKIPKISGWDQNSKIKMPKKIPNIPQTLGSNCEGRHENSSWSTHHLYAIWARTELLGRGKGPMSWKSKRDLQKRWHGVAEWSCAETSRNHQTIYVCMLYIHI